MLRKLLLSGCALLFLSSSPATLSRDVLHAASIADDQMETELTANFLPDVSIQQPTKKEVEPCTVPADVSFLSTAQAEIFSEALSMVPCSLIHNLSTVEIMNEKSVPRALAGKSILKIRFDLFEKEEAVQVLVHELGHVIQLGFQGAVAAGMSAYKDGHSPIFVDSPAALFCTISWQSSTVQMANAVPEDFVSGYAENDCFEDFSESLVLYRFHGNVFQQEAAKNAALQQKYNFLQEYVFAGAEFSDSEHEVFLQPRPWDATKL